MTQARLKILYGVQATGQGHISRARAMAPALQKAGADVDFLFSGRDAGDLYGMEPFGDYRLKPGLTLHFEKGKGVRLKNLFNNNARQIITDIKDLDLRPYDAVITDYEPISAWAAKLRGTPSIGLGNQYAFQYDIPKRGFNPATAAALRWVAPTQHSLGVHWHHFNQPILPPITKKIAAGRPAIANKIVVYLNFEDHEAVGDLLQDFRQYDFFIYASAIKAPYERQGLKFRPASNAFKTDIEDCSGIICGAGFELASEALQMGKKLLVKPMQGQPEQFSNALALEKLGVGSVMYALDRDIVSRWLTQPEGRKIVYPDTPTAVAEWMVAGQWDDKSSLVKRLWEQVKGFDYCS